MIIALDAMGTDDAPSSEVAGAVAAVAADPDMHVVLVGDDCALADSLSRFPRQNRVSVVHAPDRILASDAPTSALRRPRSSINVGLSLQKRGEADAFVSAGSTGAVMAASVVLLRPLRGVDRPPVATVFPTDHGLTLVADVGANIDCKPRQLVQFARLGTIYMQDLQGLANPRVGLLNVGTESGKGTEVLQVTHGLLAESDLNFVGNVEGGDILRHACDVAVCDGFTGNILLKFYESVAAFVVRKLAPGLRGNGLRAEIQDRLRDLDYAEHGGAPLLGIDGVSVICHGRSSPRAIEAGIGVAARAVRSGLVAHMARDLAAAGEDRA